MGSAAIGGLIAHVVFWILVVRGYFAGDLGVRGCVIALVLWLVGYAGIRYLTFAPPFATYIAIIDIGLVLVIFKGDVRLT